MHSRLIEEATHAQLKEFLKEELDDLKRENREVYEEMEEGLHRKIYGDHFSEWEYEKAVEGLVNRDGTKGPHWRAEQIADYARSRGVSVKDYNKYDLAYAMNVLYSDFCGVVGDSADIFLKMAVAFLEDPDGPEGKAYKYRVAMDD